MLLDNIIAYYKLDESSGNATDTVGGYNLTNNNTVAYASAKINNGADFGASNSTKYLSTNNNLGIDGGAISMSCWVKVTTAPSNAIHTILSQGGSSSDVQYKLEYRDNGGTKSVRFRRDRVGTSNQGSDYAYDLGTSNYHHLVLTYDNTNLKAYINGTLVDTVACSGNGSSSTGFFNIGRDDGSSYFSGLVDEVGVWNDALTAYQVRVLYRAGNGIQYPFQVIEFGNTSGNGSQGTTSWSHNNNGDYLLVALNETSNGAVSVTYGGVSMTQIGSTMTNTLSARYLTFWGLVNPATGTNTIAVSNSANVNGGAVSANNVDQTTPYTGTTTAGATSSTASVSVTTTVNNAYVVGFYFVRDYSSNGSNTTTLIKTNSQDISAIVSTTDVVVTPTSSTLTINTTGNEWDFIAIGLNPATSLYTQTCTEDLNLTGTLIKSLSKTILNDLSLTGTIIKSSSRVLTENLILTADVLRSITARILTESISLTDTTIRSFSRVISETLNLTGVFTSISVLNLMITENLRLTASVTKNTSRTISETLRLSNVLSVIKSLSPIFTEEIQLSDILSTVKMYFRTISETLRLSNLIDFLYIPFGVFRKRPNGSMSKRSIGGSSNQISSKSGSINRNNQKMGSISRMSTKTGKMSR